MPRLAIVILNYNGAHYLARHLPGLMANSPGYPVYLADNASSDSSVEYVSNTFPEIKIIKLDKNEGFAGGYNRALEKIDADFFLLLNSDVEVTPGWMDPLLHHMDKNPDCAVSQPKIRSYHKPEYFEYAGAAGGFIDFFGYPFCRGRIFQNVEKDDGQYDNECKIFWASGACFLIRASVFRAVGGFDVDFFAHMEEIDLCWRIQQQGYEIFFVPDSTVYHVGGGTLQKTDSFKTYLNFRNNLVMLIKNKRLPGLFMILFCRLFFDAAALIKFLIFDHWKHALSVGLAWVSVVVNLRKTWRKRTSGILSKEKPEFYPGSLIIDYYIFNKKTFKKLTNQ